MAKRTPKQKPLETTTGSAQSTDKPLDATLSFENGGKGLPPVDDQRHKRDESTSPKQLSKKKRTLTYDNSFKTVANVLASGPALLESLVKPKINAALREKLFLAVTSVNDCRYCKWGHSHWAMAKGVPLEEVNQILTHQTESLQAKNPAEATAILFAQHYAEQLDQFDPDAMENLRKYYSEAEVAEILAYVRFITLANLTGNTLDSFLERPPSQDQSNNFVGGIVAGVVVPMALFLTQLAKCDIANNKHEPGREASPGPDDQGDRDESHHR